MPSTSFYSDLPPFDTFGGVAELDQYALLPDDWLVLISDVVNSTQAIEVGQYKQVNMVGAASIMCVLNVCEGIEVPFSFGGDGGLIAVPQSVSEHAMAELQKLQAGCEALFGLTLRAAAIEAGSLRQAGGEILLRKYQLNPDNHLAMFAGSGTELADQWLKSEDPAYDAIMLKDTSAEPPDLDGLYCRWEPLKTNNGVVLTLIVKPQEGEPSDIAGRISDVLDRPLEGFTPVNKRSLKYRFPPSGLHTEVAAAIKRGSKLRRYTWVIFSSLIQWLCERLGIRMGGYDGIKYKDELIASTDFRKYDGALRMVLDVSLDQATTLENWLESEYQQKRLVFGTWRSSEALMTCMLFDLSQARHLHLIDGSDGGYALAARDYKRRLLETVSTDDSSPLTRV